MGVAKRISVFFSSVCVLALLERRSRCISFPPAMTAKVAPLQEKGGIEEKMKFQSKAVYYLMYGIHTMAYCLGLNPYQINKETGKVSFHWFSRTTFWSLIRLVLFNSPFSILPFVLIALYGRAEWDQEEMAKYQKSTTAVGTVFLVVTSADWISCFCLFFILPRVANKIY